MLIDPYRYAPAGSVGTYRLWLTFENGVSPFYDYSVYHRVVDAADNAARTTSNVAVGVGALDLSGSGGSLSYINPSDFALGSGEFYIRGYYRFLTTATGRRWLFGQSNGSGSDASISVALYRSSTKTVGAWVVDEATNTLYDFATSATLADETFYKLGLRRVGNDFQILIDDVVEATNTLNITVNASTNDFAVGRLGEFASERMLGQVDEFIYESA